MGRSTIASQLDAPPLPRRNRQVVVNPILTEARLEVEIGGPCIRHIHFNRDRLFAGNGFKVWMIENGNDIINMTLIGSIIAFFN